MSLSVIKVTILNSHLALEPWSWNETYCGFQNNLFWTLYNNYIIMLSFSFSYSNVLTRHFSLFDFLSPCLKIKTKMGFSCSSRTQPASDDPPTDSAQTVMITEDSSDDISMASSQVYYCTTVKISLFQNYI